MISVSDSSLSLFQNRLSGPLHSSRVLRITGRVRMMSRERGATMVEAAIVFPVLALLIFGVIQFGWLLACSITLRNASAVGARVAVLNGKTDAEVRSAVRDALSGMIDPSLLPDGNISVVRDAAFTPPRITVAPFCDIPLFGSFLAVGGNGAPSGAYRLTARTTMQ